MYSFTATTAQGATTVTANTRYAALCKVRAMLPGQQITDMVNTGPACARCGAPFTPNPAADDQHCTRCVVNTHWSDQ